MITQAIHRRIAALEDALKSDMGRCATCDRWSPIAWCHVFAGGRIESKDPWPTDTFTCPGCGREPETKVFVDLSALEVA